LPNGKHEDDEDEDEDEEEEETEVEEDAADLIFLVGTWGLTGPGGYEEPGVVNPPKTAPRLP
jgi:hypothetical protein